MRAPKTLTLVFIINGVDVPVEAYSDHDELGEIAREALILSENVYARPLCEWVVRDSLGVTLPQDKKVGRFNFKDGDRFFLMPYIGAGGATERRAA